MKNTPLYRPIKYILGAFFFIALVLIAYNVSAENTTTILKEVDSDGNVGVGTSIAVNSNGQIVMAYFDATNFALKLAVCEDNNCWNPDIKTVDNNGDVGTSPKIAITADDRPVISYFDDTNGDLKLAVCDDPYCSTADIKTVDTAGTVGLTNDITLDNNGRPLISYFDVTNLQLKLAICDNLACNAPTLTVVDNIDNPGIHSSIKVNENGLPVIAYHVATNEDLKIAICNNPSCSAPSIKTLDAVDMAGTFPTLEIIAGRIFVSYIRTDGLNVELKVARCNDAGCNNVTVLHLNTLPAALYSSMVMNDQAELFISYWDATEGALTVTACKVDPTYGCKAATHTIVDYFDSTGLHTAIALDLNGVPVISYHNLTEESLNLASCPLCRVPARQNVGPAAPWDSIAVVMGADGSPIMTYQDDINNNFYLVFCDNPTCDTFQKTSLGTNLHINPSMALQENGYPAVTYYHAATNELKFTACNNSDCSDRTTNVIAFDGYDPSLQFTSDGFPRISFYDAADDDLLVAYCHDTACSAPGFVLIDQVGKVGRYSSMILTSDDHPIISYYDETNDTVKYAICDSPTCTLADNFSAQVTDGPYNDLVLSDDNKLFIAYYDNGGQNLRILKCDLDDCGSWGIGTIDTFSADVGWHISMVMSHDNRPIITYYDAELTALKMATCIDTNCTQETIGIIDTLGGDTGHYTDMVLNGRGEPVIAYTNQTVPEARILIYDTEPILFQTYAPVFLAP